MKRELIKTIQINKANLEHIAKTGNINGTLLIEIERVMAEYAQSQANIQRCKQKQLQYTVCYNKDDKCPVCGNKMFDEFANAWHKVETCGKPRPAIQTGVYG